MNNSFQNSADKKTTDQTEEKPPRKENGLLNNEETNEDLVKLWPNIDVEIDGYGNDVILPASDEEIKKIYKDVRETVYDFEKETKTILEKTLVTDKEKKH